MLPVTRHLILLPILISLVTGCAMGPNLTERTLTRVYAKQRDLPKPHPLIFIPGITGSILEDQTTGQTVWGKTWAGLLRTLALPIDAVTIGENKDSLVAKSQLLKLSWIPGIVEVGVYAKMRDIITRSGGYSLGKNAYPLVYDWRRDLVEAAIELGTLIDYIKTTWGQPDSTVDLVTHSAGGLVARYYIKYGANDVLNEQPLPLPTYEGAKNVRQVIMLAPPHAGSLEAFQGMHEGINIPTVARITPEITFTMPSLYQLFPRDGYAFIDQNGQPLDVDLYDHSNWSKYGWSVFEPRQRKKLRSRFLKRDRKAGHIGYEAYYADQHRFLKTVLQRAQRFQEALWQGDPDEERRQIHYVVLGSGCQPTIQRAILKPHKKTWRLRFATRNPDLKPVMFGLGDGSVTKDSLLGIQCVDSQTPEQCHAQFPAQVSVLVCDKHNDLTKNPTYLDNTLHALLD